MNAKKRNQLEKNLLQTLVLFRYEEEISLIEMEAGDLNAKKAKDTGAFKKAFDGIVDKFRKPKEHNEGDLAKAKQNRDPYALTLSEEVDPSLANNLLLALITTSGEVPAAAATNTANRELPVLVLSRRQGKSSAK